jgi:predicted nucleic acid-binding protein
VGGSILDVCCFNRPFDDQTQERVRLEAEAVLLILGLCQRGEWHLVGSEAITLEINQTRDLEKKSQIQALATLAILRVTVNESVQVRASTFVRRGLGTFDALHLACAEASQAAALLTTDDRLVRWAGRQPDVLQVRVANPVSWFLAVATTADP